MTRYLTLAALLFMAMFYWGNNFYGVRLAAFLALGALWIGGIVAKRVHWSAGFCLAWVLISGAWVFGWPTSPYVAEGDFVVEAFNNCAAISVVCVLLAVLPLLFLDKSWQASRAILDSVRILCLANSLFVIGQWAAGRETFHTGGIFGNASMNACFIAFTYPILTRKRERPGGCIEATFGLFCLVVPVAAILIARSNMALASLLAAFAAPYIIRLGVERRFQLRPFTPLVMAALFFLGRHFMAAKFGTDSGRFPVWRATWAWWWEHANHWIGTGLGTYFILGPGVQITVLHEPGSHLLWAHNDWYQILFEQGFVGLALALLMFGFALKRAVTMGRPWLVASLAAFGTTMLGNFPFHTPFMGFMGAFLLVFALTE